MNESPPDSRPVNSLQLGCNTEVRHRDRSYHVQTEDSGIGRPHVITHLFASGGRIIVSRRSEYSAWVGTSRHSDLVRELILFQHREMCLRLRDGAYDALLEGSSETLTPRDEPAVDLESVQAFAERRRLRRLQPRDEERDGAWSPPPSGELVIAPAAAPLGRRSPATVDFQEEVPSGATALDELIAEEAWAHIIGDDGS